MNALNSLFAAGLSYVKNQASASLTYLSGSTTVSASVYKSFVREYTRDLKDAGAEQGFDNLYVLASPSAVQNWGLVPMKSNVDLDGVHYTVGRTINKAPGYWTVWLRYRTDSASGQ